MSPLFLMATSMAGAPVWANSPTARPIPTFDAYAVMSPELSIEMPLLPPARLRKDAGRKTAGRYKIAAVRNADWAISR